MSDGGISRHRYHVLRNTVGQNRKKSPKTIKNMLEIDRSYSCPQQFDNFLIWIACNGNDVNLLKLAETCFKKFVKSIQDNLFSADFSHSKPLSVSAEWSPKILEKRRWVRVVKNLSATGSCISPSFDLVTNIVAWFVLPKAAFSAQEYKKASRYASSKSRHFLGNCNLHCFS